MTTAGRPVAHLMGPVITRVMVMVVLLGAIAIAGVVVSTRAVERLTEELEPAASANKDVLQDLSDMQGAVRAYAQGGQDSELEVYEQALARLPGHQEQVREYAAGDPELDQLVTRQEQAAEAWLDDYARPRAAIPGGPGTFDEDLFRVGLERFAAFREAHNETVGAFEARLHDATSEAERRLRGTILAVVIVGGFGGWGVARARRRLFSDIADPLKDLELVVQRMASQDREAHASEAGPREVRAVAAALNELGDAQTRARAVELRIQSELRTLDTAKDDFISNVSHELRTPLTTVGGYLELIAEEFEGKIGPRHEKMLAASRRNVSRLSLLIEDLLALSKVESRDTSLEQVDLGAVVRDVVTDVRMTASRRGIELGVTMPEGELLVLGDRGMLHRALLNVMTNAVKFSRDDGRVQVEVALRAGQWLVETTDHGIGIPAAEIDRLGTRFFRASNAVSNQISGTGLGVRIVQTIVDKHGGRMVINSEEGVGTTVSIRIPAQGDDLRSASGAAAPGIDRQPGPALVAPEQGR